MRFTSRETAGRELADALHRYAGGDVVVIGLPRGGVVPAAEIARSLRAPLDLVLVQKIEHPAFKEFAIGALAENERPVYNAHEIASLDDEWRLEAEKAARRLIAQRRQQYYGGDLERPELSDKLVIIVDDGIATGLTMKAAMSVVLKRHPKATTIATPVISREGIRLLDESANQIISLIDPIDFKGSVSAHYMRFPQLEDATVAVLLERSRSYAIH